ncbi:hypothetical protein MNBD_BACTEROID01-1589 [hydrothermal vent metagenome]|uniref:Secretion system C-terminal sorting domain-containing protein n=1 Tax=hydrothermal vent metagenome TaxID=652676 RepID=A0A3B0UWM4_9ZZZZ
MVENCKIWEVYDAAVTNQSTTSCTQENIIYKNNIIWDCEYSFEFFNYPASSTTKNIQFINNTCLGAGYGWGHSQRPDPSGRHVCIWQIPSNAEGIIIENNIFYRAKGSPLYLASGGLLPMTVNYNDWYQDNDGQVTFELPNDIYTKGQFSQYKNMSGLDANSIIDDPLLSGYNLTKDSPCIDAGNPESPLDGDGTIADIGALYFNQQGAALDSTEEHITINEGGNYQGWTTTGQYQRVLASTSGADSVVVTILTVDHKVGNDDRNPLKPLNVVIFPNPADDNVTVRFPGIPAKGTQIELLDINGRIVFRKVAVSTYERINIESQLPGTYFVRTTFGKSHNVDTLIIR